MSERTVVQPNEPVTPPTTPRANGLTRSVAFWLFWIALAGAVTLAVLPHPPQLPLDRLGDKFNHMLAFATLTALAEFGLPAEPRWRLAERLSFLGALIEVAQSIPALHRDCDIRDWVADTLAIVVVTVLMAAVRGAKRGQP